MAYDIRRTFTLDAASDDLLAHLAAQQGINHSELLRRMLSQTTVLVDAVLRLPRDERGRSQRLCVLPESAEPPEGAQAFRMLISLPRREDTHD